MLTINIRMVMNVMMRMLTMRSVGEDDGGGARLRQGLRAPRHRALPAGAEATRTYAGASGGLD